MNLNNTSFSSKIKDKSAFRIALAGNPNVGKSSIFNELTGLNQHTGNWPGKTVELAYGNYTFNNINYEIIDLPGTYSLISHSKEEEVARDYICFEKPDAVIVVCDSTNLERNLNLCMQIMEITDNVVVCLNLSDEAKRKQIRIDSKKLSEILNVPVISTSARNKKGIKELMEAVEMCINEKNVKEAMKVKYTAVVETAIKNTENEIIKKIDTRKINSRWVALKLIEQNNELTKKISTEINFDLSLDDDIQNAVNNSIQILSENKITADNFENRIVSALVITAEGITNETVQFGNKQYNLRDRKIDKILTSKIFGIPIMLAMLAIIFWITIYGANYPSSVLSAISLMIEEKLMKFCAYIGVPKILRDMLIEGVFRVLSWVVSVMLPPMAIFFPLFTLLEDLGFLPRIAFNLDKLFKKCHTCGKQALTMCMGLGCNATGVVGCRIIDSPRERLIAILTNNFVPCNGRFPTLIAIITMFFTFTLPSPLNSFVGTLILTIVILFGILTTFAVSAWLSKTVLKGKPSSFTLELPPYRRPNILKVLVRSLLDRTLFVLGRAISIAAPAGLIIWILANFTINNTTLLSHLSMFLDPFGKMLGMDGVILIGFILGLPANEIVIPIIIMAYMSNGAITETNNLIELKYILLDNDWTWITAISMMLFTLIHWPCSTTLMTIKKESGSIKWAALAFVIPTFLGIAICFLFNTVAQIFV